MNRCPYSCLCTPGTASDAWPADADALRRQHEEWLEGSPSPAAPRPSPPSASPSQWHSPRSPQASWLTHNFAAHCAAAATAAWTSVLEQGRLRRRGPPRIFTGRGGAAASAGEPRSARCGNTVFPICFARATADGRGSRVVQGRRRRPFYLARLRPRPVPGLGLHPTHRRHHSALLLCRNVCIVYLKLRSVWIRCCRGLSRTQCDVQSFSLRLRLRTHAFVRAARARCAGSFVVRRSAAVGIVSARRGWLVVFGLTRASSPSRRRSSSSPVPAVRGRSSAGSARSSRAATSGRRRPPSPPSRAGADARAVLETAKALFRCVRVPASSRRTSPTRLMARAARRAPRREYLAKKTEAATPGEATLLRVARRGDSAREVRGPRSAAKQGGVDHLARQGVPFRATWTKALCACLSFSRAARGCSASRASRREHLLRRRVSPPHPPRSHPSLSSAGAPSFRWAVRQVTTSCRWRRARVGRGGQGIVPRVPASRRAALLVIEASFGDFREPTVSCATCSRCGARRPRGSPWSIPARAERYKRSNVLLHRDRIPRPVRPAVPSSSEASSSSIEARVRKASGRCRSQVCTIGIAPAAHDRPKKGELRIERAQWLSELST